MLTDATTPPTKLVVLPRSRATARVVVRARSISCMTCACSARDGAQSTCTGDRRPTRVRIALWRPHLREPHESAERGEQRPDTTNTPGLEPEDVLEDVGLERELQAGDVVAHLSCERHVGDGIDVLEVVGHVDVPRPAECEMVLRSTIRSSTERNC